MLSPALHCARALTFTAQWAMMPAEVKELLGSAGCSDPSTMAHAADWEDEQDVKILTAQIGISIEHLEAFVRNMPPLARAAADGPARRVADRTAAVPSSDIVVAAELNKPWSQDDRKRKRSWCGRLRIQRSRRVSTLACRRRR